MKVKNKQVWFDRQEGKRRTPKDDVYTISKERFDEVNSVGLGELVEEVIEVKKETPKKKK